MSRRLLTAFVVLVPIAWFLTWYFVWWELDECLGALRQIGGSDPQLFWETLVGCEGKVDRPGFMLTWGAAAAVFLEVAGIAGLVFLRRKQRLA